MQSTLTITLREIAARLGCTKPTARSILRRHGIAPIRNGTARNSKLWYSRRDVERLFLQLGLG